MLIAGGENLAAVDYVVIACAPRKGLDLRRLGTRVRLGHAESLQPQLARSDTREVTPLLLLAAMLEDRCHRVHLCVTGSGVAAGVIYLPEYYRTVEHRQPGPAVFLRDERGKPSGLAERAHELLGIGAAFVALAPVFVAKSSAQARYRLANLPLGA